MKKIVEKIEDDNKYHYFELYPNTEPINVGDWYLFYFAGRADITKCYNEIERQQCNFNPNYSSDAAIDLVENFWKKCFKIKNTSYNLKNSYEN